MKKSFLIITILIGSNLYGQSERGFLLQPENRLIFGDKLYCEKDYLRAIDEYNACLKFFSNDTLIVKIGLAYYEMNRFEQSEQILSDNNLPIKHLNLSVINAINFKKGNYVNINNFSELDNGNQLIRIAALKGFGEFRNKHDFLAPFSFDQQSEVEDLYNYKVDTHFKSPFFSGFLSAIIPGAGKFYTGEIGDGITSLLLTGILSFLAYDNFNAAHNTRAWIFTGLAAYFYAGNIYGSVISAKKYNARIQNDFEVSINLFLEKNNYFIPRINFCK